MMPERKKQKYRKPPSKIRYEQSHPAVSFRVDLETKKRLETVLGDQSFVNFIKETLGVKEKEIKDTKEEIQKAYNKGYLDGHAVGYAAGEKRIMDIYVH